MRAWQLVGGRQRQQLVGGRALGHGVDEIVVDQRQAINAAVGVGIQHDLDHADQLVQLRLLAQMGDAAEHVDLEPAEIRRGFLANADHVDFDALVLPFADLAEQIAEQVGVEAAAKTAIGGHHHVADALDLLACNHEGMLVLAVGMRDVADGATHEARIRTRGLPTDKKYSKIFNHIGVNKKYFHSDILKRFDHVQLLNTPLPNPKKLSELEIERMIEVMQTSLYLLERETDPCTFIDKNSLRYYELERGISIALFGMIPERQMSMESYVGYTLFKNGYPAAYGGGWIYGTRSLFGINIFEQFRGGESGYILIQLLRTYKQAFNLTYFEVEPYQYGLDNPEGIESGAFWFYYRYGFRPLDKTLNKLANSEFEKINLRPAQSRARSTQAPKTYRSSKTTLTKFTDSNIGLQLGESIPPKVTDLRAKITKMIALKFDNNRTKAIEYCIKELRSKIKIKKDLNKFEKIVLRDLALAAEALCINNTNKLNLIGKMIELKPVDLYSYNLLLSDWLK
jgi:hypothetical protein